ncbi:alpha-L-fucosidase [Bacteroides sp. UBA939]|uniref:alpha-L-fucosidase n=1 Tax=Bacteroides sp. UBA939 TaxID=1946092 RepID=UPI0025BDDF44|nr:alpha-L-fucosidase [Bacteroides sp. UBA939]
MNNKLLSILVFLIVFTIGISAQNQSKTLPAELEIPLKYGADRLGKRSDAAMLKFRENRLGTFIHWGLYAIPGGEWKGKVYSGAAEWLKSWAKVPSDEWMKLMEQWNPEKFNAKAWAKMAKQMGVKYVKITTKHHEGFCLWPSKYTENTVANTPHKKDILGELVKAYNDEGIDVHFYFSVMDWSHPDYRYEIKSEEDEIAFNRFLTFTDNQLKELATRYPTVKDFWFDGTWDASIKKNGWWTAHVEKMLKDMLPGVTINSRLRADDFGKRHFDSNGHLMGDYESGYERRLPDPVTDLKVTRWDWEACMTVPENQWGYHKDWSLSYVKTTLEVLERIIHAVSMGGNMVVNFGPQADGDFRKEEKALSEEIGQWMKQNGECVYSCDYAGFPKQNWGYYTRKGNTIYMVVFNVPYSGKLVVKTPRNLQIQGAATLSGNQKVEVVETAGNEYNVSVPAKQPGEPFVIKLEVSEKKSNNSNKYREALT